MSATAVRLRENRAASFWQSTNGKKIVMAVTGAILFAFVIGHMLGNLQVFDGPKRLNAYGHFLHSLGEILWAERIVLLTAVALHITATVQLALRNQKARPVGYSRKEAINSSHRSGVHHLSPAAPDGRHHRPGFGLYRGRCVSQCRSRVPGVVGFGVVYLRGEPAGPAPATRHLEHVSVGRPESSALYANAEECGDLDRRRHRSGIYFHPDQRSVGAREINDTRFENSFRSD
jgi:hypothetical protein